MKIEDFAEYHLRDVHKLLDEVEEKDPKIAEKVAMSMMLNISARWQGMLNENEKKEQLKNIDNLN